MEGKRFGAGLVAGLLFGLVIVTASSGFAPGLNGSPFSNSFGGSDLAKSATTSTTASAPSQNALNSTLSSAGRSTTTTSSTTGTVPSSADHAASSTPPQFSSRVGSIAQQPILTNVYIFLPVLVAFLLGAVLYRVSIKRRADSSEPAK